MSHFLTIVLGGYYKEEMLKAAADCNDVPFRYIQNYTLGGLWSGRILRHLTADAVPTKEWYGKASRLKDADGIDRAPKIYVDFKALEEENRAKAEKTYDGLNDIFGGEIPHVQTFAKICEQHPTLSKARHKRMYMEQEAYTEWKKMFDLTHGLFFRTGIEANLDEVQDKDSFIRKYTIAPFLPHAVIFNGRLFTINKYCRNSLYVGVGLPYEWPLLIRGALDALDPSEYISCIDCDF